MVNAESKIIKQPRLSINGILLLDKPIGITSNAALQRVKQLLRASKAGHTGSLDPLASGMLPLCFGHATKVSQFLLAADKRYEVTAKLGVKTTTGDAEGEVIETCSDFSVNREQLQVVLNRFVGLIQQVPSMYSALKHQGQPLYKLARQGITIERAARDIHIYEIELLDLQTDQFTLRVHCSKGTYVRTLIEDIGEQLDCGGHVTGLRRLSVGVYQPDQMVTFEDIDKALIKNDIKPLLLPIESGLLHLPDVHLSTSSAFYFTRGQGVFLSKINHLGLVRVYDQAQKFLGVGEISEEGKVLPKRLM